MKRVPRLAEDPVVAEVHSIRAELWCEGGGTVAGLIQLPEKRKTPRRKPTATKSARRPRRA